MALPTAIRVSKKGPTGPRSWICLKKQDFELFRENWRSALLQDKRGESFGAEYWESQELIPALGRSQLYSELASLNSYMPPNLLRRVWSEVIIYRRFLNTVRATNTTLQECTKVLSDAATRVLGMHRRNRSVAPVEKCSRILKRLSAVAARYPREYWARELRTATHPAIFKNLGIPLDMRQERNLDSWFQIRVAAIFRHAGSALSRHDLTRLVLLSYICAGLAEERGDSLYIARGKRGRELKLTAIYEKLRDAGLR